MTVAIPAFALGLYRVIWVIFSLYMIIILLVDPHMKRRILYKDILSRIAWWCGLTLPLLVIIFITAAS